jgi:beta-phosphoglucomutase-like phosphatase (HAD superfamily)
MLFKAGQISMTLREWDNPVLFQHALKQLNIPADEAIAFGNEICDVQAASNAGIKEVQGLRQTLPQATSQATPQAERSVISYQKIL